MKVDLLFVAVKAFIVHDGKVLILRESSEYSDGTNAGRYDVVGGRVKPGEQFDVCLLREIKEETGLDVTIGRPFHVGEWYPSVRGEQWQIIGTFFECHASSGEVRLSEDHDSFAWIDPARHAEYNLISTNVAAFKSYIGLQKAHEKAITLASHESVS